jgi:hypothetical protein
MSLVNKAKSEAGFYDCTEEDILVYKIIRNFGKFCGGDGFVTLVGLTLCFDQRHSIL